MGLTIVKQIADAHRASLRVDDNRVGQGAVFTL